MDYAAMSMHRPVQISVLLYGQYNSAHCFVNDTFLRTGKMQQYKLLFVFGAAEPSSPIYLRRSKRDVVIRAQK